MAGVDRNGLDISLTYYTGGSSGSSDDDSTGDDDDGWWDDMWSDVGDFFGNLFGGGGGGGGGRGHSSPPPPPPPSAIPTVASDGLPATTQPNGGQAYVAATLWAYPSSGVSGWAVTDASYGLDPDGASVAPSNQVLPCFVKGAATGAITGLVVAGATAALATVASPAVVTGALFAAGAYGGYRLYHSVKDDLASKNNAGLAYSAGSLLGGAVAGGATSYGVRYSITGETNLPTGILDFLGVKKLTNPFRPGNSIPGNIGASYGKGPDLLGGGAAIAGAGAGIPRKGC